MSLWEDIKEYNFLMKVYFIIIEGSEGSINVSKMEKPLTPEQIKLHRKKWKELKRE